MNSVVVSESSNSLDVSGRLVQVSLTNETTDAAINEEDITVDDRTTTTNPVTAARGTSPTMMQNLYHAIMSPYSTASARNVTARTIERGAGQTGGIRATADDRSQEADAAAGVAVVAA